MAPPRHPKLMTEGTAMAPQPQPQHNNTNMCPEDVRHCHGTPTLAPVALPGHPNPAPACEVLPRHPSSRTFADGLSPPALLRNSRRDKAPSSRPLLEIYSASGLLLASVPWKSGRLVHLGWTAGEDLLCIQEDGTVLVYNLFCEFKRHFSMGNVR
ncbi:PREDICTED: vacuolar protein sorting-associated protein 16 homolog, partial [Lepidothrix coronata]|uniref:Vacuolar protein sorting-associated protein 16 homolog n=1 Tax=Lepidothrix coronata TaxID=321398 RepID=A0A6J0J980_9PASS